MTDSDEDPTELETRYSVGSFGPFPINFYSQSGEFFYNPQEHGERGPFDSLEAALEDAEMDFGTSDGGFHETEEEADAHAEWMREEGYGVE